MISQSLSLPITTPTLGAGFFRAMTPPRKQREVYHRARRSRREGSGNTRKDLSHPNASLTMAPMPAPFSTAFATRCAAILAVCVSFAALAQPTDADFAAARDAYRAGDSARLDHLAPRLKGHLLEPYVAYWRLRLKLDDADPSTVRAFLERYADMPLADRLRGEWLKSLGRRGAWELFAAEYPARVAEDVELSCYAAQLQLQRKRDGDNPALEVRRLWFSGHEQPEACQPLFGALLAQGALSARDVWARFRLAHEAGNFRFAARIAGELPPSER